MGVYFYVGIWILQILMQQNLNFKDMKELFVKVTRKDPNRGPQNWQKYILQPKNVVAGKNLPYELHMNILVHMASFSQPQHFFAAGCILAVFGIALIFYPVKKTL